MTIVVSFVVALSRSGVGGGVGCASCVEVSRTSGVMAIDGATEVIFGVVGSLKDNCVCRTTFGVVSVPVDTLVCFVFSPRLGEGLLPLAPLGLRRFACLVMVDYFAWLRYRDVRRAPCCFV